MHAKMQDLGTILANYCNKELLQERSLREREPGSHCTLSDLLSDIFQVSLSKLASRTTSVQGRGRRKTLRNLISFSVTSQLHNGTFACPFRPERDWPQHHRASETPFSSPRPAVFSSLPAAKKRGREREKAKANKDKKKFLAASHDCSGESGWKGREIEQKNPTRKDEARGPFPPPFYHLGVSVVKSRSYSYCLVSPYKMRSTYYHVPLCPSLLSSNLTTVPSRLQFRSKKLRAPFQGPRVSPLAFAF